MLEGIGNRLKALRTEKGLSMDMVVLDIEQKYGIKIRKSSISRWENESAYPQLNFAAVLASYYGVSLDYLAGFTSEKAPADLLARSRKRKR